MRKFIARLGLDDRLQPDNIRRYARQCSMAAVVVLVLLLVLDGVVGLSICKQLVLPHLMDLS